MNLESVRYSVTGEGQTLLLVNMHFQRIETWSKITEDLSRYYRLIFFEFPNQGSSREEPEWSNLKHYSQFLVELLGALGENPQDIIAFGYSFGSNVIRSMCLDFQIQFKAVILGGINPVDLSDYYVNLLKSWEEILENGGIEPFTRTLSLRIFSPLYLSRNPTVSTALIQGFLRNYETKPRGLRAILRAPINYFESTTRPKEKYLQPVHLIGCENDMIVPGNAVSAYAKILNAESFHQIQGSGHDPLFENPAELFQVLDEILQKYEK